MEALVAACPRLEAVDLSHCVAAWDREMAALAAAAGLRELVMDKCLSVTDVGLAKVAVGCPGLRRLSIKWCREISDISIELLAKKCPDLKLSNESLGSLSTPEKLEDIAMVGCLLIDDDGLEMLRAGNSLQEIETCFLSKLSTIGETLTVLRLAGLETFASNLQAIADSCKNLVEIGLSKCNGVTDDGIASLVVNCGYLRTVDVTCCHLLTNDALAAIAENCRMLNASEENPPETNIEIFTKQFTQLINGLQH
ncbi:F-box/LRR-repeat protein 3-like [Panicum miliaceum]|uniref:F-box/LRR-repeat protein 3-like n=1 Tax=Panicum miliaceum TaxID=4540 RepID=A0A3L6RL31_PANMI|nr:F-box/LRR-repeat protein 3-like [Panicum miliaceum]